MPKTTDDYKRLLLVRETRFVGCCRLRRPVLRIAVKAFRDKKPIDSVLAGEGESKTCKKIRSQDRQFDPEILIWKEEFHLFLSSVLPTDSHQKVILDFYAGKMTKEIAEEMDLSHKKVRSLLMSSRQILRKPANLAKLKELFL